MCLARGCFLWCLCLVRRTGQAPFLYLSSCSFLVCVCFSPPRSFNSVAPGFSLGPRLYLQSFSPWAHLGSWWLSQMYVSSQKSTPELPIHTSACVQAPSTCAIHLNLTCASTDFSMWLLVTLYLCFLSPKISENIPHPLPPLRIHIWRSLHPWDPTHLLPGATDHWVPLPRSICFRCTTVSLATSPFLKGPWVFTVWDKRLCIVFLCVPTLWYLLVRFPDMYLLDEMENIIYIS